MTLHVEQRGSGPDLVLLHGWALHGGLWGNWLDALEDSYRLHLVDLPGHGRSDWSPELRSLEQLAAAVRPGIPTGAVVLGWSLGGLLALEIADRWPQALRALVLVATTPRFVQAEDWESGVPPQVLLDFARSLQTDHARTVQNFLALQTRGDEQAAATLRLMRRQLESHGPPDPRALATGLEILGSADLRSRIGAIAIPALVAAGENDRLTPPGAARALASALPQARLALMPGCAHAPFLSHPDDFLAELRPFLDRCTASAAQGRQGNAA